jgi:hypothetical protein
MSAATSPGKPQGVFMKIKGKLVFVLAVLSFCFLSCFQDKGLERFQKIAVGSWNVTYVGSDYDSQFVVNITKDKISLPGENAIDYHFDKSKIYLKNFGYESAWSYNILNRNSFTVTEDEDDDLQIEFTIIDRNNASMSIKEYNDTEKFNFNRSGTSSKTGKSSGRISALYGRWTLDEGSRRNNPEEIDLLKDKTGIVDGTGITWKIENGRFYLIHPGFAFSAIYNVSGSTLTLTKDDGEVLVYRKK